MKVDWLDRLGWKRADWRVASMVERSASSNLVLELDALVELMVELSDLLGQNLVVPKALLKV